MLLEDAVMFESDFSAFKLFILLTLELKLLHGNLNNRFSTSSKSQYAKLHFIEFKIKSEVSNQGLLDNPLKWVFVCCLKSLQKNFEFYIRIPLKYLNIPITDDYYFVLPTFYLKSVSFTFNMTFMSYILIHRPSMSYVAVYRKKN